MLGLVLSGGKSTRMGTDKGLLKSDGASWAKLAQEKLHELHISSKISINNEQLHQYQMVFSEEELIVDQVLVPGPLAGILSAHYLYPSHDLVVLGCDLPDMHVDVLYNLLNIFLEHSGENDFFCYHTQNYFEPMVSIFTSQGLHKINNLLMADALPNYSLQALLATGNTAHIPLPEAFKPYFKNYNLASDLHG